jgi:hypothetical protein
MLTYLAAILKYSGISDAGRALLKALFELELIYF